MSLDDLEVTLRASVGTTSLSLDELLKLEPGFTFSIPAPSEDRLVLEVDGQVVGSGQAVEQDGRLGARLTEIDGTLSFARNEE